MTTTLMPNLATALAKVQASLPKIDRDRTVTVEPRDKSKDPYSYSYVTLANLSEAILPLLAKHGLSFAAMPGAGADGKMCVRYHLLHESGEQLSGEFPISGEGGIQMIGGRITYARRYCLAAIVGVAADEDDEARLNEEGGPRVAQRAATTARNGTAKAAPAEAKTGTTAQRASRAPAGPPPLPGEDDNTAPVITPKMRNAIFALWGQLGYAGDANRDNRLTITRTVLGLPDLKSTSDLTPAEGSKLIDALQARLAKVQAEQGGESS